MEESSSWRGGGGGGGVAAVGEGEDGFVQNVVVMRHGDRIDAVEPLWVMNAERPWDPPLVEAGRIRAWNTGKRVRDLGFPVHRVVVSPFLRCLQTAAEVVRALCADVPDGGGGEGDLLALETSEGVPIDPSRVKVSIEFGLCEILCRRTIGVDCPQDGNWFPDISELEAVLPAGTLDHSIERLYKELPLWEEPIMDARERYRKVILALADKFPNENLLLVTHGEGVGVALSAFLKGVEVFEVDYCACTHLQRKISSKTPQVCTAEPFTVLTRNGQTGISFYTLQ